MPSYQPISNATKVNVLVVGLGYVGFPLLLEAALVGYRVFGLDNNEGKIKGYITGDSREEFYEKSKVEKLIHEGIVTFHSSADELEEIFDIIIICVPTPLKENGEPDLSYVVASMDIAIELISTETLVILESSSYPGTTRTYIYDRIREKFNISGSEKPILVAYSPERIDPGNDKWNLRNTPKLVSGINQESFNRAKAFYSNFIEQIIPVNKVEDAELAKLFENTFRLVNISLVNEFVYKLRSLHCNPRLALEAAYTKPFGIMKFQPSPGIGGHCIPVDPVFLISWAQSLGIKLSLVESSYAFLNTQIKLNADLIQETMKGPLTGKRLLLVGASYKPNVADSRESPAFKLKKELEQRGAHVEWYDPHVRELRDGRIEALENWKGNAVVLVTQHLSIPVDQIKNLAPVFINLND